MNKERVSTGLNGKHIVLIGGSSGFGLATAQAAADEGAEVFLVSSNRQRVDSALATLPSTAKGYAVDITDHTQLQHLFKTIGQFDHLVFSAGESLQLKELDDVEFDEAKQFFNIRFWGALAAAKYAHEYILHGGSIILTNGTIGLRPMKGWAVAASITGAIESLTRALAVELAPIRVNAVCAGMVRTELWSNVAEADREAMFADFGSKLLTGKIGEPEEVAQAYVYLMKNGFSTGQIIVSDGGGVLV